MVNAADDAARLARAAFWAVLTVAVRAEFVATRGVVIAARDVRAAVVWVPAAVRPVRPPADCGVAVRDATVADDDLGMTEPVAAARVCVAVDWGTVCDDARFVPVIVVVAAARPTDDASRTAAPA